MFLKRTINIHYKDDIKRIEITGKKLEKNVILDYFGFHGKLTYVKNGLDFMLITDDKNIYLNETQIDYYLQKLTTAEPDLLKNSASDLKLKAITNNRLNDMVKMIKERKNQTHGKRKLNESQSSNQVQKKKISRPNLKRSLTVGWKHAKYVGGQYNGMGTAIGASKKITLNSAEDYTVEELKEYMIQNYFDEDNKFYLQNSIVNIATAKDGLIVDAFKDEKGAVKSFWEWAQLHRNASTHELKLVIYTMSKREPTEEEKLKDLVRKEMAIIKLQKLLPDNNVVLITNNLNNEDSKKKNEENNTNVNLNLKSKPLAKSKKEDKICDCHFKAPINLSAKNSNNEISNQEKINDKENVKETSQFCSKELHKKIDFTDIKLDSKILTSKKMHDKENLKEDSSIIYPTLSKTACNIKLVPAINELNSLQSNKGKNSPDHSILEIDKIFNNFEVPIPTTKTVFDKLDGILLPKVKKDKFVIGKKLDEGGQGAVYKGLYLESAVAIKTLMRGRYDKSTIKEIKLMSKLRHPQVINIMAYSLTSTQVYIIMELFEGNSLNDVIFVPDVKKNYNLTLEKKNHISKQICAVITYLHLLDEPVIHRDLKPSNILVDKNDFVKVCDLGMGKIKSEDFDSSLETTKGSIQGTYSFMAPEVLVDKREATTPYDVWSAAGTLVELYTERRLWERKVSYIDLLLMMRTKATPKIEDVPEQMSLKNMLEKCFNYDPQQRPTMSELHKLFKTLTGSNEKIVDSSDESSDSD